MGGGRIDIRFVFRLVVVRRRFFLPPPLCRFLFGILFLDDLETAAAVLFFLPLPCRAALFRAMA